VIRWLYRGINQRYLGNYRLIAEIYSGPGKRAIRRDEHTFTLVSSTKCEKVEKGEANIEDLNELYLSSVLDVYHIDPVIPYIGGNKNWWIDGQDTGMPSTGEPGPQGPQGIQGPSGGVEVVNNLEDESQTAALSAAMGKVLARRSPHPLSVSWLTNPLTEESIEEIGDMAGLNFDVESQNLRFSILGGAIEMVLTNGDIDRLVGLFPNVDKGSWRTFEIPLQAGVIPIEAIESSGKELGGGGQSFENLVEIPNWEYKDGKIYIPEEYFIQATNGYCAILYHGVIYYSCAVIDRNYIFASPLLLSTSGEFKFYSLSVNLKTRELEENTQDVNFLEAFAMMEERLRVLENKIL
jgi:hypothetical protein